MSIDVGDQYRYKEEWFKDCFLDFYNIKSLGWRVR